MFAKHKSVPATKPKVGVRTKTVSMKTGVKTVQGKKVKGKDKPGKVKPAVRVEPGYSLYSTDTDEQVSTTFSEMERCEKILTQLRSKQKGSPEKGKKTSKTKNKEKRTKSSEAASRPMAQSTMAEYGQYQSSLLRYLQHPDYSQATNPAYNQRLSSSTPDPDKLLHDQIAARLLGNRDYVLHDPPERDINVTSASSVPLTPSSTHVRNMADMASIYSKLEKQKLEELKEACVEDVPIATSLSSNQASVASGLQSQAHMLGMSRDPDNQGMLNHAAFHGSGSLGFVPIQSAGVTVPASVAGTQAQPVPLCIASNGIPSTDTVRRDSHLATFQPYLSRDSLGFKPPESWLTDTIPQNSAESQPVMAPVVEPLPLSQQAGNQAVRDGVEEPVSGRSEKSGASSGKHSMTTVNTSATDYVMLPQPVAPPGGPAIQGDVVFRRENGLYQIHQTVAGVPTDSEMQSKLSALNDDSAASSSHKSQQHDDPHGDINEVPERDVTPGKAQVKLSVEEDVSPRSQTTPSQHASETPASTPRYQNSTGSSSSHGPVILRPGDENNSHTGDAYQATVPMATGAISQSLTAGVPYQVRLVAGGSASGTPAMIGYPAQEAIVGPYYSATNAQLAAAGDVGVRKLRYLLKELRECNKVTKDVEINRLVKEIDSVVNAIPQLAVTFNLQTEVDLALQPLRSENSQLRRKLRLLNQQLRGKELEDKDPKDVNFETLHLQTSNEALQRGLKEEKESKTRLAAEIQFLLAEVHKMKVERTQLIAATSEKETEQLKLRQESLLETQTLRHEVELAKKEREVVAGKLEALEKENHILQISLQQRDSEVGRLQDTVSTLKDGISELLQELDQSRHGDGTWDHNSSFGLHKLMKVMEEESSMGGLPADRPETERKTVAVSPEKRTLRFTSETASAESTPRLTRAALKYHDRRHSPREASAGPKSDTEIDNTLIEMVGNIRQSSPMRDSHQAGGRHRRTTSSSPVRLKLGHHRTVSSPIYTSKMDENRGRNSQFLIERRRFIEGRKMDEVEEEASHFQDRIPPRNSSDEHLEKSDVNADNQSRYSVTDYFRKYPSANENRIAVLDRGGRTEQSSSRTVPKFQTSTEVNGGTLRSASVNEGNRNIKQLTLFKGMHYDQTISAIDDDDRVSSVSMSSVSTANTVDERKFRSGIATLDANIAKLQQALQKTKNMLA